MRLVCDVNFVLYGDGVDPNAELMGLNLRIGHSNLPNGADPLDAVWGKQRARYFELTNATRVAEGLPPLANDEDFDPALALARREQYIEAELRHCEEIEMSVDRSTIEADNPL